MNRITSGQKVNNEYLQEFSDDLQSFRETMHALDCLSEVNQQVLVKIVERLPVYVQHRWRRQAAQLRERDIRPGLDDLVSFVRSTAREVADPVYGSLGTFSKMGSSSKPASQPPARKGFQGVTAGKQTADGETRPRPCKPCVACQSTDGHALLMCPAFKNQPLEKRFNIVKDNNLCFNCLRPGHSAWRCRADSNCNVDGCRLKHSKFLHISGRRETKSTLESKEVTGATTAMTVCHATQAGAARVALPIVKVAVRSGHKRAVTYALLDSGSTNTFCTMALLEEIGSGGEKARLGLMTLGNDVGSLKTTVHEVEVSDPEGLLRVTVEYVYATPKIPVPTDCIVGKQDL